jgi:hypothetical protein
LAIKGLPNKRKEGLVSNLEPSPGIIRRMSTVSSVSWITLLEEILEVPLQNLSKAMILNEIFRGMIAPEVSLHSF